MPNAVHQLLLGLKRPANINDAEAIDKYNNLLNQAGLGSKKILTLAQKAEVFNIYIEMHPDEEDALYKLKYDSVAVSHDRRQQLVRLTRESIAAARKSTRSKLMSRSKKHEFITKIDDTERAIDEWQLQESKTGSPDTIEQTRWLRVTAEISHDHGTAMKLAYNVSALVKSDELKLVNMYQATVSPELAAFTKARIRLFLSAQDTIITLGDLREGEHGMLAALLPMIKPIDDVMNTHITEIQVHNIIMSLPGVAISALERWGDLDAFITTKLQSYDENKNSDDDVELKRGVVVHVKKDVLPWMLRMPESIFRHYFKKASKKTVHEQGPMDFMDSAIAAWVTNTPYGGPDSEKYGLHPR
jgi:hypothetical protein